MFIVETRHHKKEWRKGDLEDALELEETKHFKTRKAAKEYVESKLRYRNNVQRYYHSGDTPSNCYYFTGMTWTHENTGEKMEEYYQYTMQKVKL